MKESKENNLQNYLLKTFFLLSRKPQKIQRQLNTMSTHIICTRIMADKKKYKAFFVRMDNLISRRPLFGPPFICLCNFFQLSSFCGISLVDIYEGGGDIGKIINPR